MRFNLLYTTIDHLLPVKLSYHLMSIEFTPLMARGLFLYFSHFLIPYILLNKHPYFISNYTYFIIYSPFNSYKLVCDYTICF